MSLPEVVLISFHGSLDIDVIMKTGNTMACPCLDQSELILSHESNKLPSKHRFHFPFCIYEYPEEAKGCATEHAAGPAGNTRHSSRDAYA